MCAAGGVGVDYEDVVADWLVGAGLGVGDCDVADA